MKPFAHMIERISAVLDKLAGLCFFSVMVLIVANIFLRVAFARPILGTYELVGFLTALGVGFALAQCSLKNGHIAVDFIMEKLSRRVQSFVGMFVAGASLLFWGAASWYLFDYGRTMKLKGLVSSSAEIPIYPFIYLISLGVLMLCLTLLFKLLLSYRELSGLSTLKRAVR